MQYIHNHEGRNDGNGLAHCYAARVLHGIRRRMQGHSLFSEEDSTDVRNASGQGHSIVNFPVRNAGGRSARLLILYGVSVVNI
jgi:hypothetical protein